MVCPHFQGLIMVHQWLIIIFPYFPYSSGQEWGFFFHFQKHLHILRMHWSSLCSAHAAGRHWVPGEYPDNKIQQNCLFFFLNLAIFFEFWCHYLFDPVKIGWNRFYSCQKYTIYAKIPRLPLGVTMRGGGKSPRNVDKPHIRSGYVHILGMIWQTKRSIVLAFFC